MNKKSSHKNSAKTSLYTRAVHAGEHLPPGDFTPVSTPIYPSVGYTYPSMGELDAVFANARQGYVYARYGSPTVTAFELAVGDLEEGEAALAFSSGMAALHVALLGSGVQAGSTVLGALDLYGATFALLRSLFASLGVGTRFVDVSDLSAVEATLAEYHPVALIVETISNPLLKVADLPTLAGLARRYGAQLLVDNTFATPCLITPLTQGADYVIHSATKYLAGHGDMLGGVVVTSPEKRSRLFELNKLVGSVLGPFEAWLGLRGLKTLPLRVNQQCQNALAVAQWLLSQERVTQVNYPGLPQHPQHALAQRLFRDQGYGGVLSFEIQSASREDIFRMMDAFQLIQPATTLGDIYSLALHPATSSHRALTAEERAQVGIHENLIRLSLGIEDLKDILEDLERALKSI